MNDPVALLLVIGFIDWIQDPGYGFVDMTGSLVLRLALGAAIGLALGRVAVTALNRVRLPTDGIYPVATIAIAGPRLWPGGGRAWLRPARHLPHRALPGLGQHPSPPHDRRLPRGSRLGRPDRAVHPARAAGLPEHAGRRRGRGACPLGGADPRSRGPSRRFAATLLTPLNVRERAMLGWAGLRGATPIWLATFPVVAGVGGGPELFSIVFFVVVTSTLVQGASFEPLAIRLGLTTSEPALPRRLLESGRIRRMGGDVIAYRLRPESAAAGRLVRELGLPREALVNVIVRDGRAIPPRGSTELREGRRASCPGSRRAARGGRGADAVAGTRARSAHRCRRPCPVAAPRRSSPFALEATSTTRPPRAPSTGYRWWRCCAVAATAPARWSRSPTAATR